MVFADLLDLVVGLADKIYLGFISIFNFFTKTPFSIITDGLIGSDSAFARTFPAITALLRLVGDDLIPFTLVDLMFGVGLPFALAWILASWILNLIN